MTHLRPIGIGLGIGLVGLVCASSLVARAAAAQDADACIAANERSVSLRNTGRLIDARAALASCASPACPEPIRSSCGKRMADATAAVPTVVFAVKDAAGNDLPNVQVTQDGVRLGDHVVGSKLELDPGPHSFTFDAPGWTSVTKTFTLVEGVKSRAEVVVLAPAPATPSNRSVPPNGSTQKMLGIVVGSMGIAGLVVGTIFGALASSTWNNAQKECGTPCTQYGKAVSDQQNASTLATVSTVGFVAGGAALAAGAILWLTAPRSESSASTAAWSIAPSAGPSSASLWVTGAF